MNKLAWERIDFSRDEVPCRKRVNIDGKLYQIEIAYNSIGDFFTMILLDDAGNVLHSSRMNYMTNAFDGLFVGKPSKRLVPMNLKELDGEYLSDMKLNWETFGERIQLYLI